VPRGIIGAIGASWLLGFLVLIVISACMNPDIEAVLSSPFGQPMAQVSALQQICKFYELTILDLLRRSW
jgi:hypothetical protein